MTVLPASLPIERHNYFYASEIHLHGQKVSAGGVVVNGNKSTVFIAAMYAPTADGSYASCVVTIDQGVVSFEQFIKDGWVKADDAVDADPPVAA